MGLTLLFHGGNCCGIKTIKNFCGTGSSIEDALAPAPHNDEDKKGHLVNSNKRFFADSAPEETTLERLDRYIEYCKKHRPSGMIEVTLNFYQRGYCGWGKHLEDRGFKKVASGLNSNSGNVCYVYYLVYKKEAKKQDSLQALVEAAG